MILIHLILALATAVIATAYAHQRQKEQSYNYCDADKALALVIGCSAGVFYPLAWLLAAIYVASEKIRKDFIQGDDQ